ncbi:MAG: hypothetical protein ABSA80_17640 [Terriglobales bacterium]|jgi:hypothetical protein
MRKRLLMLLGSGLLLTAAYLAGTHNTTVAYAGPSMRGAVPKSYGKLVAAISDSIGTGLVFEDAEGVIRFVSVNGMKEGELARFDTTPTRGGIPRSYGHLVTAVVNNGATGLVFEDANGVIRFVTLTGVTEGELIRE